MNFLLHGYLARRDLGSGEAAVGAMLPDLWRMADRHVRPRAGVEPPRDASDELRAVLTGIDHHVSSDRWFHAADVLLEGERAARERLTRAVPRGRRVALLAHVAWELCLDGALVEREGLEPTLEWVRAGLGSALGAASDRAADLHHFLSGSASGPSTEFERVARVDRALFLRRVHDLAHAIAAGPWVAGYTDGAGLASRLSGVRARLGVSPFEPPEHTRIAEEMCELLSEARGVLDRLLTASSAWQASRGAPPD